MEAKGRRPSVGGHHTKLGRQSVSPLCGLDCVDVIVTDSGALPELVAALRAREIEVVVGRAEGEPIV